MKGKNYDGTVDITFKAEPLYFIDDITIIGNSSIGDVDIKAAANIRRFSPFYEDLLIKIKEEIISLYRNEGFLHAEVDIESDKKISSEISIKIKINEGKQEIIKKITVEGEVSPENKRTLEKTFLLKYLFAPYTETNFQAVSDEIETYFHSRGYFDVRVRKTQGTNQTLAFFINQGSRYLLNVSGNKRLSRLTIEKVVYSLEAWHQSLEDISQKLLLFYQSAGFPEATIKAEKKGGKESKSSEDYQKILISINEGPRKFLRNLQLKGVLNDNENELKKEIFEIVADKLEEEKFPPLMLNRTIIGGGYTDTDGNRFKTDTKMKKDRIEFPAANMALPVSYFDYISTYISNKYIQRGFKDVKVLKYEQKIGEHDYDVVFDIQEGENFKVAFVDIVASNQEIRKKIYDELTLNKNVAYNDNIVNLYKDRIKEFLQNNGYLFSRIHESTDFEGTKVRLTYTIDEVFAVNAAEIVINGNYITEEAVVRRMLRFNSGETLSKEKLTESRQYLLQTGVFETARITFIDADTPSPQKDMVVMIQEAKRGTLSYGFGASTDEGGRLTGGFEYKNLFGKAYTFRLSTKVNRKIELFMNTQFKERFNNQLTTEEQFDRQISTAFIIPDLFFLPVPISGQIEYFHIYDTKSWLKDLKAYNKNSLYTSLYKRIGDHYFLAGGAEFSKEFTETYAPDKENPEPKNPATTDTYNIEPDINGYIDFRNDPFFPIQGWKSTFKIKERFTVRGRVQELSGEQKDYNIRYTFLEQSFSFYVPLLYKTNFSGEYVARDNLVFHTFLKYGLLSHVAGIDKETKIQPVDVLKLGGATTLRGFSQDSLMPQDDSDSESQAKYSFLIRNELRIKVMSNLYFVGFFDSGNLWEKSSNIGKNGALRYSSGGGIMIVSPIGSVNIESGFNLVPKKDEDLWAFHFFISSF